MKRRLIKKPIQASSSSIKAIAKKRLYARLQAAFDALDDCYSILEDEYKGEMDSIYQDLEVFVRELDADVN